MEVIHAYTDGSCNNHTHCNGGYAVVFDSESFNKSFKFGKYNNTTSARMEIMGVIAAISMAVKHIKEPFKLVIYCDNEYVCNTYNKNWLLKWQIQGLDNRKNGDLWKLFIKEFEKLSKESQKALRIKWIRGHNGNKFNEKADKLAKKAGTGTKTVKNETK